MNKINNVLDSASVFLRDFSLFAILWVKNDHFIKRNQRIL